MNNSFSYTLSISATPQLVWQQLTDAQRVAKWMSDTDMQLEIETDWQVNSPIFMRGDFHGKFENKGIILACSAEKYLSYTHLSSISELADRRENYTLFEFELISVIDENQTVLALRVSNFPTDVIRKHLELYWPVTLQKIKEQAEEQTQTEHQ